MAGDETAARRAPRHFKSGDGSGVLDNRASEKETEDMKELVPRIFQADFLKGMGVTFRTQFRKNIYTEQYPLERPMVAERFRGAPRLNKNPETGETLCIACNLCALACPENLIVVAAQLHSVFLQ